MAETKTSTKKDHPTYQQMISGAIASLKERNGSSRPAVKKYILANHGLTAGAHFDSQISAAIRRGVEKGIFALPKGLSGTIKLVKPEKKVAAAPVKKATPTKKSTPVKKASPVKKVVPVKKVTKRAAPVKKVEAPEKKVRKAPTKRVTKEKKVATPKVAA